MEHSLGQKCEKFKSSFRKIVKPKIICESQMTRDQSWPKRDKIDLTSRKNFSKELKIINPQAPVAQKIADEVVFRRFQGEGVEFF